MLLRIALFSFLLLSSLWGHKLNVFAYDEEGKLFVQSYFTKSSPCKQCTIKLLGANDTVLLQLTTNDDGKASSPLPSATFSILVEAGMGHQQRLVYEAKSHTKDVLKQPPEETPLEKIVLGLGIIIFFFGGMYWFKKRLRQSS